MLSSTYLNKKISRELFKYFELNENKNATYQNMWEAVLSSP